MQSQPHLKQTLGPLMLWGLGVGYVISGMYFGWNLGLIEGGTYGMAAATLLMTIMYIAFTFSYTELACAIPKAGGAFDYAYRALGPKWGFIAGLFQIIEFVFAPPAIAAAIGAYLHIFFPTVPVLFLGLISYFIFTALNIYGVRAAASFELVITILAIGELLLFAGVTLPHFSLKHFQLNAFPNGFTGILASLPFALWFFLGIEGVANVAEETINPQVNVRKGLSMALLTLIGLCILTFTSAVGVGGWEKIVYEGEGLARKASDSPLPLALGSIMGSHHILYHLLVTVGIFGLVASFHGIILAAGRATFEFGRKGFAPAWLGKIHPKFKTPWLSLIFNMLLGILALLTGKTSEIIALSCFGALGLYALSSWSLIVLRKKEPHLPRPYKVPCYPYFPMIACTFSLGALISMAYFQWKLFMVFLGILIFAYLFHHLFHRGELTADPEKI